MKWYDIVFIIIALVVIVLSLLQGGKSEGASGAITGGGLNVFAKTKERGSEKVISWLTFGCAVIFLFLALLIMVLGQGKNAGAEDAETTTEAIAMLFKLF
ncbi:MAG: preprotein translocase subunit SecG [Bacilli bacterium]|nr:preprotein translocase subunit SecG [Bacilli bacterium]